MTDKNKSEKKSEKIEVRLSFDEKTDLTRLAEQEDRSVSDLVRGLIARYVSINTTRLPQKRPWALMAALLVGGFFAGHLMTFFIAQTHKHDPIYNINALYQDGALEFPLLVRDGTHEMFSLQTRDGVFEITAHVEKREAALPLVKISICQKTSDACDIIAQPVLVLNPIGQASMMLSDKNGETIMINARRIRDPKA